MIKPMTENRERRKHGRKKVKVTALLKMGIHLNGRGYAKDVSVQSLCIVAPGMFQFLRPSQMNDYLGAHIKVLFPSLKLTVTGTLVRIDPPKGEGAIMITGTTDDCAWEALTRE
jgi:hypothetical protein